MIKLLLLLALFTTVSCSTSSPNRMPASEKVIMSDGANDIPENSLVFKDILDLSVSLDGDGKISVGYDKAQQPVILRLVYKNSKGNVYKTLITFSELEKNQPLLYLNSTGSNGKGPERKIVVERGKVFYSAPYYQLVVSVLFDDGTFDKKPIVFNAQLATVSYKKKRVAHIQLSPDVSFFKWTGRFDVFEFYTENGKLID